jgi:predicted nucleotidyltransferase
MNQDFSQLKAWCSVQPIDLCVLFGSRAHGKARPDSDYDLAFRTSVTISPIERVNWQVVVENMLNADASIVLLTPQTDPVLGWEIARVGQLIFESQPGVWADQRLRLWHSYNDALPFRRGLAESLRRYAEGIRHAS